MLARALLLLLLLVLVWQSKYVLGAQNQTPQDVTRSSFPKGFVFGAASAAYQVNTHSFYLFVCIYFYLFIGWLFVCVSFV